MAPFLDEDSLHELTVEFLDGNVETDMAEILPYLSEDDVALILTKISQTEEGEFKGLKIDDLLPFADDDSIDNLFLAKFEKGEIDSVLVSFVSDECWHKLVLKYCEDEKSDINIDAIYPYLDEEDLNLLFRTYLKRSKNR